MELEKLTYYFSSINNSIGFNIVLNIKNNSKFTIEMIKVICCIENHSNQPERCVVIKSELFIESNDSKLIDIETPLIVAEEVEKRSLKIELNITCYRRAYYDLGVSDLLKFRDCFKRLDVEREIGGGVNLLGLEYSQDDSHEESDNVQINVDGLFSNTTDVKIEELVFGMIVIGEMNEIITRSSSSTHIDPNSIKSISVRSTGIKSDRIKYIRLQHYLTVYIPIVNRIMNKLAVKE